MDKFSELKAAAMAATPGQWAAELTEVWVVSDGTADFMLTNIFGDNELSAEQDRANAAFIAAANPPAVLELLAELEEVKAENMLFRETGEYLIKAASDVQQRAEEAESRIAELDRSETQLIEERDVAHDAIDAMYEAATGERPEWSNCFGFADAIEEVAQVRARLATPVRLPARKAVRHPAGYPEDAAREAGYNEALSDFGEALDVQGFTVEGALVTAMGHQGGAHS